MPSDLVYTYVIAPAVCLLFIFAKHLSDVIEGFIQG